MNWYWLVAGDNVVSDPLVVDANHFGVVSEDELIVGEQIRNWPADAWLAASHPDDDGVPDDMLQNHLGLPIYSEKLRRALDAAGIGGIQYLPVKVIRPNKKVIEGFCVANIVAMRPALDLARSDYDVFPDDYFLPERRGKVRGVRKATLKSDALVGCDIIRLQEFFPDMYASARFKEVFEAGRFTGCVFRRVQVH